MEYKKWLQLIIKRNNGKIISPESVGYCSEPLQDGKKYEKNMKNKKSQYKYF